MGGQIVPSAAPPLTTRTAPMRVGTTRATITFTPLSALAPIRLSASLTPRRANLLPICPPDLALTPWRPAAETITFSCPSRFRMRGRRWTRAT